MATTVAIAASAGLIRCCENKQNTRIAAKPSGKPPKPARVLVNPRPGVIEMPEAGGAQRVEYKFKTDHGEEGGDRQHDKAV